MICWSLHTTAHYTRSEFSNYLELLPVKDLPEIKGDNILRTPYCLTSDHASGRNYRKENFGNCLGLPCNINCFKRYRLWLHTDHTLSNTVVLHYTPAFTS